MGQTHPARQRIEQSACILNPESTFGPTEAEVKISTAISLKRIADALDSSEDGGRPQGSVLWWLEMIASAANAGRS